MHRKSFTQIGLLLEQHGWKHVHGYYFGGISQSKYTKGSRWILVVRPDYQNTMVKVYGTPQNV